MAVAAVVALLILGLRRVRPGWPSMLIAVVAASAGAAAFGLPVETIGERFGAVPAGLPAPRLPDFSLGKVVEVLPTAFGFALLGSIESLLSAMVADGMTGRRHRSNCELVAQGVANMGSALVGGICVTGTVARTATNVRAGAHGPLAGVFHAGFLLVFLLIAAPLAAHVPLAALAGVLTVVAWNMVETRAIAVLLRASRADALVLLTTFLLAAFRDVTEAIIAGVALGGLAFIARMSRAASVERSGAFPLDDQPDTGGGERTPYDEAGARDPELVVYRLRGALFFGAAAAIGPVLDRVSDRSRLVVIDLTEAAVLDSTMAHLLEGLATRCARRGASLVFAGASAEIAGQLARHGLVPAHASLAPDAATAIARFRAAAPPASD